jgi:hypothetical protein
VGFSRSLGLQAGANRIGVTLAVGMLSVSCSGPGNAPAAGVSSQQQPARSEAIRFEGWRSMMERLPKPNSPCLVASYPALQWRETQCAVPPANPLLPANGLRHQTVGDGTDFTAIVSGYVNLAEGEFSDVTGVTSEYALKRKHHRQNVYSLQLNTQFFSTESCAALGSPDPQGCFGWEQFAYDTGPPVGVFIEYWLADFGPLGTECPSGWHRYSVKTQNEVDCWINSKLIPTPVEPITALKKLRLLGAAAYGSRGQDFVELIVEGGSIYYVAGQNWFPDLQSAWQDAEFNIFGDCCGDQATFNPGSTIDVRTQVDSGASAAPTCQREGFTAESNNLFLTTTPVKWPQAQYPSVVFAETNGTHSKRASCVTEGA